MSSFIEAEAPMTAKCIIRDALKRIRHVPSERDASRWAAEIIGELHSWGYEITARPKRN